MIKKCVIFALVGLLFGITSTGCASNNPEKKETPPKNINTPTPSVDPSVPTLEILKDVTIYVNQLGYRPEDEKKCIFTGNAKTFTVHDAKTDKKVFEGVLGASFKDTCSGETLSYGDFTTLKTAGSYYIQADDSIKSYPFEIEKHVYKDVKNAMLKAFYYQRCGIALEEKYAGDWKHASCHLNDGYLFTKPNQKIDAVGGWHDAGDFGKYTGPGANALAHLLLGYELFSTSFSEPINIPESGNGVPDVLNECRYELEWLLKMQVPETGGVYHKLTTLQFPGEIMPENDREKTYIQNISPTATGDFAAIMAMAARIYQPLDPAFSQKMKTAATLAWTWLENNPDASGFKNPKEVATGEYGDQDSQDERLWAAAELYKTTNEPLYHDYFSLFYGRLTTANMDYGWADMSGLAATAYLFTDASKTNQTLVTEIKTAFFNRADYYTQISAVDGFKTSLSYIDYGWGSNMGVMNRTMHLILAYLLNKNTQYHQVALDNFHYLLGRNALNQSYVTGYGSKPVMHPHHRPSSADGVIDPVPGMVAGGPNRNRQDPAAQRLILPNTRPAKCYIDYTESYSTNEIAIYWNSPTVFVAAFFDQP